MARNDLAEIEREVKETLWIFIGDSNNIKEKDACFEKIYKYTRSEATLKDHNMKESVNYYKNLGYTDMFRTYLWDKQGSLDILLKGWIPKQLTSTIYNYQLKKDIKSIKDIIIKIVGIIERKLYEIWKIRNDIIIEWEKQNNISKKDKRDKGDKGKEKSKENKENKYKKNRVGRINYIHRIDEEIYNNIKKRIGLGKEDNKISLDKRVNDIGC